MNEWKQWKFVGLARAVAFLLEHGLRGHSRRRTARLRDGTTVILRPIQQGDLVAFRDFMRHLSPKSRYLRFHTAVTDLSDAQWQYLVSADGRDHVGVIAWKGGLVVGVGCYFRLKDSPDKAEVAFAVADALQRRGLGSLLCKELVVAARRSGIRSFRAELLAENRGMRRLLRGAFPVVSEFEDTIEVALDQQSARPAEFADLLAAENF